MKKNRLIIFTVLFILSCNSKYFFPDYPVRLSFNITANAPELAAFNGYKEFENPTSAIQRLGYGGILVFHTIENKFVAFDMACTNEVNKNIKVRCNNVGIAICDSCQTQFYVGDGMGFVQKGPAKMPLKKYSVYYDQALGNIIVTN